MIKKKQEKKKKNKVVHLNKRKYMTDFQKPIKMNANFLRVKIERQDFMVYNLFRNKKQSLDFIINIL